MVLVRLAETVAGRKHSGFLGSTILPHQVLRCFVSQQDKRFRELALLYIAIGCQISRFCSLVDQAKSIQDALRVCIIARIELEMCELEGVIVVL